MAMAGLPQTKETEDGEHDDDEANNVDDVGHGCSPPLLSS